LAIVLGVRPDVIRACLILNAVRSDPHNDVRFIWSGQHYSDNLKDTFFRELGVKPPEIELNAGGETDAEIIAAVITRLYRALDELRPEAAVFLGDTNTVMGSLAAAQLNIPVVHIEGCMRAYDWRMPEEKYRTVVDHLSDVIYTYFDEYKRQGIDEGLNPESIVVVGNPIVDVLNRYYYERQGYYERLASDAFFRSRGLVKGEYYLMTCHRRENVHILSSLRRILDLVGSTPRRVYFAASYRTQKVIRENHLAVPPNVTVVDPIGYEEMLVLITRARGVITDSGTVVEETCVLQVPSLQLRKATERPQVYDVGSSVKFDPAEPERYSVAETLRRLEALHGRTWPNPLGDGKSSERIAGDLLARLAEGRFARHKPSDYHLEIRRSFREDGLHP